MIEAEVHITNPFPGLRPFEEEEDYLFFGRERQVDELLKRLRATRFLAVVGASGSGKSSLVKCGLLPSLHSGYMTQAGSSWRVAVFRPGSNPIGNLAEALCQEGVLTEGGEMADMYRTITETTLRRSDLGLTEAIREAHLPEHDNLLIVADQFEELFRFSRYEKQASGGKKDSVAFIKLLLNASRQTDVPVYIVLTMRSDFLGDCTQFRGLPEAINEGQYLIPRMTREELRSAITGPVAVSGAEITKRLEVRLLNDVGDNPDQLPILQHALMRTWNYWGRHKSTEQEPLDLKHYEAIGTMSLALSQHAEEAFAELKTPKTRRDCELLFKAITDRGSDSRGIRRPTTLGEIAKLAGVSMEEMTKVIEIFRKPGRSFLMPPAGIQLTEESIIDISHESLMRIWARLIKWVEEETQSAEVYLRLAESAALYQEGKAGVWRDPELQIALKWRTENKPNAAWAKRYDPAFERAISFLDYSKEQRDFEIEQKERQQKMRMKRARIYAVVLGAAAIVSLFIALFAYLQREKTKEAYIEVEKSAEEARKAQEAAEDSAQVAKAARLIADENAQKAKVAQEAAQDSAKAAMYARMIADENAQKARDARTAAEDSAMSAKLARIDAEKSAYEADSARKESEKLRQKELKLKLLAESRNLSFEAIKYLQDEKGKEAAGLALQAHQINRENDGPLQNNDNYQALMQALGHYTPEAYVYNDHAGIVRAIAVNANNGQIATGDDNGNIHLLKIANGTLTGTPFIDVKEGIRAVSFANGGKHLIVSSFKGTVTAWDLKGGEKILQKNFENEIAKGLASVILNDKEYIIYCTDTRVYIGSISGNEFIIEEKAELPGITSMAVSDGGAELLIGANRSVYIYHLKKNKTEKGAFLPDPEEIALRGPVTAVAVDAENGLFAAGLKNGNIYLAAKGTGQWKGKYMPEYRSTVSGLQFYSKAGRIQLASCSYDRRGKLFQVNALLSDKANSGEKEDVIVLNGHDQWLHGIVYNKEGDFSVTISADKKVRIWFTETDDLAQEVNKAVK